MLTKTMTLDKIQKIGLEALSRELGPVGMIRFLQMFETGYGDYSKDRYRWLREQRVEAIVQRIQQRRGGQQSRE